MTEAMSAPLDAWSIDSHGPLRDKLNGDAVDEDIIETIDSQSSNRYNPAEHGPQRSSADHTATPLGMFGDLRVFRDFFLAAFSDGYHNVRF